MAPATAAPPRPRGPRGEPIVTTTGLRKTFRSRGCKVVAVEGLDLTVTSGGIHGYLGPNGSGKTTTIRMWAVILVVTSAVSLVWFQRRDVN